MPEPAMPIGDLETIAARMLGQPVTSVTAAAGGGNNRVYRIETLNGLSALKFYPLWEEGTHDRSGQEFAALEFLTGHGVSSVPAPVCIDHALGCALYEWIDGTPIIKPNGTDVDAMVAFAALLKDLSRRNSARGLQLASEACFSATEIERQILARLQRLIEVASEAPELSDFLTDAFEPALMSFTDGTKEAYLEANLNFDADIAHPKRTLSPSDFGFHNALRRNNGEIVFVDFEYFGWDDPVRLVCDFVLHPGHRLSPENSTRFVTGIRPAFADDEDFDTRVRLLYPLIGLRWCMIILAEFLPLRMTRRRHAGRHADSSRARHEQLEKAVKLLGDLTTTKGAFPDGD